MYRHCMGACWQNWENEETTMNFELETIPQQWRTTVIFTVMMLVAVAFLWSTSALSGVQSVVAFVVAFVVTVACEIAYVFAFGGKGRD